MTFKWKSSPEDTKLKQKVQDTIFLIFRSLVKSWVSFLLRLDKSKEEKDTTAYTQQYSSINISTDNSTFT